MSELTAAALRLLESLAAEGAYGFCPEPDEPGILAVVGQRNGISLRQTSAPLAAVAELERGGLAVWQRPARARRRFVLTARGWANLGEIAAHDVAVFQRSDDSVLAHAEAETCP